MSAGERTGTKDAAILPQPSGKCNAPPTAGIDCQGRACNRESSAPMAEVTRQEPG
jgi:hypothetical protein